MPGFSYGLIMAGMVVFMPLAYMVCYGLTCFDAWRFGKEPPRHKVMVNVLLSMIIGFIFGGITQHIWDNLQGCLEAGYAFNHCLVMVFK